MQIIKQALFLGVLVTLLSSCGASKKTKSNSSSQQFRSLQSKYASELGVSASSIQNERLYVFVDDWRGVPYKYGGTSKGGTDCSGFVGNLYREVYSKNLPRSTKEIDKHLKKVSKSSLREGDVVFFDIEGKKNAHMGVYLQNERFVHASTSKGVVISSLENPYYKKAFSHGAR